MTLASHDAYKPAEIAGLIETAGVAKARMPAGQILMLAVLGGAFIALGGAFWLMVVTGADPGFGPLRLLGGAAFSLGLILCIVGGAELFTGNALMVMAAVDGKIGAAALLRNWGLVYLGNALGALGVALAFHLAGMTGQAWGETAAQVAGQKTHGAAMALFWKGVLCNALVCLAVWLSFSARDTTGKVLAVLWPVTAFVTLGLEHSVANMFLLPLGWLAGADLGAGQIAGQIAVVTLGNVLGGAGGVALAYRTAYLGRRPF